MTTNPTWIAVDDYLEAALLQPDPILQAALTANAAAALPSIDVAPNQGKLLHLLARLRGARRILEIGTLGGYSTIWLARALPSDGILISLEFEPRHAAVASANIAHAGLSHLVQIRVGAALDSLIALERESAAPFDLIFIDADKQNNAAYLRHALTLSRIGTLILVDNVIRDGAILDPNHADSRVRGTRRFFEALKAEPRLEATAIQTVGSKGYDGFAMALVIA
jgi:predicted O-methyltransferase YrrM